MSAVPDAVDSDAGPPMTVPLRHFVVALAFLVSGVAVGWVTGRRGHLAQVHLLLAGWVCLTIMGAMTQFVPVWSGVTLHSRRLATVQLPLAAAGFGGLAVGFLAGKPAVLPVAGAVAVVGVWTFVYNLGRTLAAAERDVTTTHFAVALGWFVVLTLLGLALAIDHATGVFDGSGLVRGRLLMAHATVGVFGAILTTVAGALAQLVPMFTQTGTTRFRRVLQRFETVTYPAGVAMLAGGRLVGMASLARVGGLVVAAGLGSVALVVAERLYRANVAWSAMLQRYAVATVALACWTPLATIAWLRTPLAYGTLFGHPATGALLLVGGVGFVVVGTLYHVVPFIVWVHRYSDRLGFERVPAVADLYDSRVAAADGLVMALAGALAVAHEAGVAPPAASLSAGILAFVGTVLFAGNLVRVVVVHSPQALPVLVGSRIATEQ